MFIKAEFPIGTPVAPSKVKKSRKMAIEPVAIYTKPKGFVAAGLSRLADKTRLEEEATSRCKNQKARREALKEFKRGQWAYSTVVNTLLYRYEISYF